MINFCRPTTYLIKRSRAATSTSLKRNGSRLGYADSNKIGLSYDSLLARSVLVPIRRRLERAWVLFI